MATLASTLRDLKPPLQTKFVLTSSVSPASLRPAVMVVDNTSTGILNQTSRTSDPDERSVTGELSESWAYTYLSTVGLVREASV